MAPRTASLAAFATTNFSRLRAGILMAAWWFVLFQAAAFFYDRAWDTLPVNVNDDPSKLFNWSDPQWLAVLKLVPSADERVIDAFADAIGKLDDSVPTGTYVDMCSRLPVNNPDNIKVPTLIMRGQWDGIAGFDDLIEFFKRLPNPDKQFAVMPGISHASFQQKNYMLVYHILLGFFSQPAPVYRG